MIKNKIIIIVVVVLIAVVLGYLRFLSTKNIEYKNTDYGFTFTLPADWKGYSINTSKWVGDSINQTAGEQMMIDGPLISIRNPKWTKENPYQDIPIMIISLHEWDLLQQEKFHIGAAPIGPSELRRNSKYVFALPARYNYAFPQGYEEVEKILQNSPLHTFDL